MDLPPNVLAIAADVTTNGTINTSTDHVLLAAPGAGFRYRIWSWSAASPQNAAAGRVEVRYNNGGLKGGVAFATTESKEWLEFMAGGYAQTANSTIILRSLATIVSTPLHLLVMYTLEAA